jgi:hypothetical protein
MNRMGLKMTKAQKMVVLREWQKCAKEFDEQTRNFSLLTGATSESPFLDSLWKLSDEYSALVAWIIGIDVNELSWYWYDNRFGEKKLSAKLNDVEKPICTIKDFAWMLGIEDD